MASLIVCWLVLILCSSFSLYAILGSIAFAIVSIVNTASIGYSPAADSPDSIIASDPSKIAFATSDASALVGLGDNIIDSNMCVAVMTGLPNSLAFLIIRF